MIKNKKGQSTIEFLTTFIFIFGLLFLFIKIALNATEGYAIHYATYMASRAYLVNDRNSNSPDGGDIGAALKAKQVFKELLTSVGLANKVTLEINAPSFGGNKALVGLRAKFKQKFSFMTFLGGDVPMEMVSESYLGREPSKSECIDQTKAAGTAIAGGICSGNLCFATLFDNGC